MPPTPSFLTVASLARAAGVSRSLVLRLIAANKLQPDATFHFGVSREPLFFPTKVSDVALAALPLKRSQTK